MSPFTFFAISGALAWLYATLRFIRFLANIRQHARGLMRRLRWAVLSARPFDEWSPSERRPEQASRLSPHASGWARRPARYGPYH